tara:strand:+ start:4228 stop:5400 length:1173 start_codon:yes stop_codon:yes gene_type:complete
MAQVSDYNVANASAASVRSELNDILEAIKTLNSGGTDPSSPEAFMLYVDTNDSNNLKIRNSANNGFTTIGPVNTANLGLLPVAGGTMSGQITVKTGTSASPSVGFSGDQDTGFFQANQDKIGFTVGGSHISTIENAGLFVHAIGGSTRGLYLNDADNSRHIVLRSPDTVGTNLTYRLPATITDGGFMRTDSSGNLSFQLIAGVPTGVIFALPDTQASGAGYQSNGIPDGYVECNGTELSRTTFAALFNVIGTRYGAPTSSTFRVPDLRGEFIRGFDGGKGTDPGRGIGTFQASVNLLHDHTVDINTNRPDLTGEATLISETFTGGIVSGVFTKGSNTNGFPTPGNPDTSPTGTLGIDVSHSHSVIGVTGARGNAGEGRPRNIAMMYIIKV